MVQDGNWLNQLHIVHCGDIPGLDAKTEHELRMLHVRFYEEHQKWVTECPHPVRDNTLAEYARFDDFIVYARCGNDVLGFVSGSQTPEDAVVVSSIFVQPEVREFGIARRLIRELFAIHSPREVVASVLQRNRAGNRLFARLGFNKKCSYGWCEYRLGATGINNNDQNQVGFSTTGVV